MYGVPILFEGATFETSSFSSSVDITNLAADRLQRLDFLGVGQLFLSCAATWGGSMSGCIDGLYTEIRGKPKIGVLYRGHRMDRWTGAQRPRKHSSASWLVDDWNSLSELRDIYRIPSVGLNLYRCLLARPFAFPYPSWCWVVKDRPLAETGVKWTPLAARISGMDISPHWGTYHCAGGGINVLTQLGSCREHNRCQLAIGGISRIQLECLTKKVFDVIS
ncbi:hypothetical protein C8R48DRAFT_672808 [Suillus tomentosus]|nr:hypothetical protein C8R48DRAFT_672808 [Suillus tomentosus]